MKKNILIYLLNVILLVLVNGNAYSQTKNDVKKYHSYVSTAESFIIQNKLDSALIYYNLAFDISEKYSFCFHTDVLNYKELCIELNVQPMLFKNKDIISNVIINFIDSLFTEDQNIRKKRDIFHPNDSIENLIKVVDYNNYLAFRKKFLKLLPNFNCSSSSSIINLNTLMLHFSSIKKTKTEFLQFLTNNIDNAALDPKECMEMLSLLGVNIGSELCPTKLTYINPNDTAENIKADTLYIPNITKETMCQINNNRAKFYLKTLGDSYKSMCFMKNGQTKFIFFGYSTTELVFYSKKELYNFKPNYTPLKCNK